MAANHLARRAAVVPATLLGWMVAATLLPSGLPVGVVLLGMVLGGLMSLTAMGLVLVHRSSRVVNFAQAEIGGLAAGVAVVMVAGWQLPYFAALPVGLGVAVLTGWLIDATVVRRFFRAPRLILTVATIGLAQILGAIQLALPNWFAHLDPLSTFETPFDSSFSVGPLVFRGDHVVAMVAVPVVMVCLGWFFGRTDTGIAVRAAADSTERALLLGIPIRRLSRVTWMLAAGLSGLGSMLAAPILGPSLGVAAGSVVLLAPLTAAVIGRMESLPVTAAASIGIGVFQQAVFWNYPRSSTVEVGLFGVVLLALLLQRRNESRVDDGGLGGYAAVAEPRPVPREWARLSEVRAAKAAGWIMLAAVAVVVPLFLSDSRLVQFAFIAIYGVVAVSLVVLTGWAGQVSLGQFAFVGAGAATTAALVVSANSDLFLALVVAALVGATAAAIVGLPALRIPGLFLGVTTLAFAVPVSTFVLNAAYFPTLTPSRVERPEVFGRFELASPLTFYFLCLVVLAVAVVLARNYRRTRAGRAVLAVRDNERGAAAFSIIPVRAKLTAFAFSGALAGIAGGLYVVALRGMPFSGFSPESSLVVFTMVVIGGVASIPGALVGAVYVRGAQYFLHGAAQLLATGAGLLVLLMLVPGGLGALAFSARDRALRAIARRRGLVMDGAGPTEGAVDDADATGNGTAPADVMVSAPLDAPLLRGRGLDAGYDAIQVLFGVDVDVGDEEVVALLGTNGAGKSTVLKAVAGLLPARAGRIEFDGRDITHLDPIERVKAGLVMVPGGRGVFGSLTVAENLRLAGWLHRRDRDFVAAAEARVFALFPVLRDRLGVKAASLSGGEQQMLTLSQALFCRPRLLMIDELTLGLAPSVVTALLDVVRRINAEGTAVVVVEQSLNVATRLAPRALFMEKGQVRFSGATAQLHDRPDLLRSVFLRAATPVRANGARRRAPAFAAGPPRLEVRGLAKRFGGVTAVDGVDLTVAAGEILGVIGSNGAGKTTLFDLCSGFVASDEGRVLLGGRDVTSSSAAERADRGLGRSFQDARLFPSLTVAENLAVALERHLEVREPLACTFMVAAARRSEHDARGRVDELVATMGLERYRHAFVSELSTGTRRIVELGCAMAHSPSVLLLDEPSSGIAQRESESLRELLLDTRHRTGASLVVIEHDIPLVTSIADRLVCLHLGRVVAEGSSKKVLADPQVVASYLGTDEVALRRSGQLQV